MRAGKVNSIFRNQQFQSTEPILKENEQIVAIS